MGMAISGMINLLPPYMNEQELYYYYPYRIDKERNLRRWISDKEGYIGQVLGQLQWHYENGQHTTRRQEINFSEEEKRDNYLKFTEFLHWHDWFTAGQNIFSFTSDLLEMLDRTDVDQISIDSIRLPYGYFYISLLPLRLELDKGTHEIVEGVFVSSNPHFKNGHSRLEFQFAGSFTEAYRQCVKPGIPGVYKGNFWDFSLDFDEKTQITTIGKSLQDEIEFWKLEIFSDDEPETVGQEITDNRRDFYNKKVQFSERIIKLVINCLLYLSLPKDQQDIKTEYPHSLPFNFNKKLSFGKTRKEREQIGEKIKSSGYSKINFVGTTYKRPVQQQSESTYQTASHWRRGHWRNQPFGQGLKEKKLIWIQPTLVGKDATGGIKGHLYNVEGK
jgi:hypothetical protein